MNKIAKILVVACSLLLASAGGAMGQARIGTIDLKKVFDNYWKTKQADAVIKDRAADMEKEYKNMLNDFEKSKTDYQSTVADANNQALSSEERDKRKKSAEDKLKQLKDLEDSITTYRRTATTTLEEQKKRMRDNILGEIKNILSAKAQTAGYSMVIDTAAESINATPVVMYLAADNNADLTAPVLAQLNVGAPTETPKTDEKKPEAKKPEKK
jgi:outer membrane protein